MDLTTSGKAAKLYGAMESDRMPYWLRAQAASRYTIPHLIPPQGTTGHSKLYVPFQSIGARGVNNLANKLSLTLLPPTRRFYRLITTEKAKKQMNQQEISEVELALSKLESSIDQGIEKRAIRARCFDVMRHLVVAGNVLIHFGKTNTRVFPMYQYVVRRGHDGTILDLIIKETVSAEALPDSVKESVKTKIAAVLAEKQAKPDASGGHSDKNIDIFTHVYRDGDKFSVVQEVMGEEIPESRGTYPLDACEWLPLRWNRRDGEDYGRSHCDDYIGDLMAAESLSRSIIRASAVAAKIVFLVARGSQTNPKELNEASEGEYIYGNKDDIGALQVDKYADLRVAREVLQEITQRLSFAFLLNSAIQRQGERVTAEEIRFMAQELEDAVGGTYSILSTEFQLPLVIMAMKQMEADGDLPPLPKKLVQPTIITGIDALGRSHELARLDAFMSGIPPLILQEVLPYINVSDYLKRRATGLDINPDGLLKPDAQVQQEQQQAQMQQMAQNVAPHVVKAASDHLKNQSAAPSPASPPNG